MSAKNPKVLRRNYTWLPLYELCLMFPMVVGFAAILVWRRSRESHPTISRHADTDSDTHKPIEPK